MDITSISARVFSRQRELQDLDATPNYVFQTNQYDQVEQYSQKVRLASTGDDFITWQAGGYFHQSKVRFDGYQAPYFLAPVANFARANTAQGVLSNRTLNRQRDETLSFFAAGTANLTDALRLNAGLRYTRVNKRDTNINQWGFHQNGDRTLSEDSFRPTTVPFNAYAVAHGPVPGLERTDDAFLPSVGIEYDAASDVLLYANIARGFKAGGFDFAARTVASANDISFGPERVTDYEAGIKARWFDGILRTNVNVFWADYSGVQESVVNPSTFVFTVQNAAASRTRGVEFDIGLRPVRGSNLTAEFTILDAEYREFIGACSEEQIQTGTCPNALGPGRGGQDLSGHRTTFSPPFSGVLRSSYVFDLGDWGITLDGSVFYTDSYNIQSTFDPFTEVSNYARVDGRIAVRPPLLRDRGLELALVGKNLNDIKRPFFCNVVSGSPGSYRCSLNPPSSVSLQASLNF